MTTVTDSYPLQWPNGWARTPDHQRRRSAYKMPGSRAVANAFRQLELMGANKKTIICSSNLRLRLDGLPYADSANPNVLVDVRPAVARDDALAVLRRRPVERDTGVLHACGLAVEALRQIDRCGASQVLDRAFEAFGALPAAAGARAARPWWEVLGLERAVAEALSFQMIEARYRELATKAHPDRGGSEAAMAELNKARDEARHYFSKG